MDSILHKLKEKYKTPPRSWSISVKVTEKILKQNEILPKIEEENDEYKGKYQTIKKISNQIYIENCIQENKRKIEELEQNQSVLKDQLSTKINESTRLQKEISKAKSKKHHLKKENEELRHKIKELKNNRQMLDKNIEEENPTFEIIEEEKSNCELQLKHYDEVIKMITTMKNKRMKVQFAEIPKEKLSNFPKMHDNHRLSRPQILMKPDFSNNQTRKHAKSYTGTSKRHQNELELSSINGLSSSQIIEIKTIDQQGCITVVKFSKTGRFYATGNENRRFCLYETGQCIPFETYNLASSIISIDFNEEESVLLVACLDTIYLFDFYFANGRCHARQKIDKTRIGRVHHAEFISSDQYIVCIEGMPIQLYKVGKRGPKYEEKFHSKSLSTPYCATGTGRGGIAAGFYDGRIRIFDPCSCEEIIENKVHNGPIYELISKESIVISLSKDGTIAFTNYITHDVEKKIQLKECGIIHNKTKMILFGDSLLVGGSNGLICEYDIDSGKFKGYWENFHHASITALSASAYSVISGDQNGLIKIWNDKN